MGLYECVVAAQVKSGEGILEEMGDVAACSTAHWCLPAGVCCPHLFAQMLCRQIQACRYSLLAGIHCFHLEAVQNEPLIFFFFNLRCVASCDQYEKYLFAYSCCRKECMSGNLDSVK